MKDIELVLPKVLPYAPGCAEPTAIAAIRQAAIEFCEASRSWRSIDEFEVSPDNCTFVCVPADAELFEIESVTFNGRKLEPISVTELDRMHSQWRDGEQAGGAPRYYTQITSDTLQIAPAATGTVRVDAFVRPSEEAQQLPDYLIDKYRSALAHGALAKLLLLPGQPFFSTEISTYNDRRFQSILDRNFNLNIRGQQRAPTRTKPHYF